jgi:uncharacterized tellurite resistance protein B-like protein
MNLQSKKPDMPASQVHALLLRLVESTRNLTAASDLSSDHHRYIQAALLASVIMADEKIGTEDLILHTRMATQDLQLHDSALDVMADSAADLQVNLPSDKRMELIALLWELLLCDDAHHPREAERIEKIVKMIGVSSLRAMTEKMNAAAKAEARRPS